METKKIKLHEVANILRENIEKAKAEGKIKPSPIANTTLLNKLKEHAALNGNKVKGTANPLLMNHSAMLEKFKQLKELRDKKLNTEKTEE